MARSALRGGFFYLASEPAMGAAHGAVMMHAAMRAHGGTMAPRAVMAIPAHPEGAAEHASKQAPSHKQSAPAEQEGKYQYDQDEFQHCSALLSGVFVYAASKGLSLSTKTVYQNTVLFERRQSDSSNDKSDRLSRTLIFRPESW